MKANGWSCAACKWLGTFEELRQSETGGGDALVCPGCEATGTLVLADVQTREIGAGFEIRISGEDAELIGAAEEAAAGAAAASGADRATAREFGRRSVNRAIRRAAAETEGVLDGQAGTAAMRIRLEDFQAVELEMRAETDSGAAEWRFQDAADPVGPAPA